LKKHVAFGDEARSPIHTGPHATASAR
jgi:hypothetical protein